MIGIDLVIAEIRGLQTEELERWVANRWVRPDGAPGQYVFREIDVARVRLIWDLRNEMMVNDEAVPIVLSLLDQLYDLRRHLRDLGDTLHRTAPDNFRQNLIAELIRKSQSRQ